MIHFQKTAAKWLQRLNVHRKPRSKRGAPTKINQQNIDNKAVPLDTRVTLAETIVIVRVAVIATRATENARAIGVTTRTAMSKRTETERNAGRTAPARILRIILTTADVTVVGSQVITATTVPKNKSVFMLSDTARILNLHPLHLHHPVLRVSPPSSSDSSKN